MNRTTNNRPLLNRRPLCLAAVGVLFGTLLVRALPPPDCYLAALVLLGCGVSARLLKRTGFDLLFVCMALALARAGLSYPADGVFASGGSVFAPPDGFVQARAAIGARIEALFGPNGGVARGMLLGDKAGIADETLEAFENVGILHLLAVSGLHVSVLAGAFSMLFRGNAWVRLTATAGFLLLYAALTAFSPSVVRAGVMLLFYLLACPLRRPPDGPSALALAFVLVVLAAPMRLFTAGFQLSFCAVYGLILLVPLFEKPLRPRVGSVAAGLMAGSLSVVIATVPAMCLFFREVSLLSILTNVLVLPLAPLFLVPAFWITALSAVSLPAAQALSVLARVPLDAIVAVARAGGRAAVPLPPPNTAAYLLYLAALLFGSQMCLRTSGARRVYAAGLLLLSLAFWALPLRSAW